MTATGPLFAGPSGAHGVPWLHVLVFAAAVPAMVLLLFGLVRGGLPPALRAAGVLLPIAAYAFGGLLVLEGSKQVGFCGSCHVMRGFEESIRSTDGSLAAIHYGRGLVPHDEPCYTCHSGYGIWGTIGAKRAGVMHMVRTVTGRYELPITLRGKFDIDSCLNCHAFAPSFRAVEAHQDPDLQGQLVSRELGCTGMCHPAAHPERARTGGGAAS